MRKLIVAVAALAILALTPGAGSGALVNIDVLDDEFSPDDATFDFPSPAANAVWDWGGIAGDTTNEHTVRQKKGLFDSGNPKTSGEFELAASSGKYPYFCEVHGNDMKGKVTILVSYGDIDSDQFRVIWATSATTTGKFFDVRYRIDGGGWNKWKSRTRKFRAWFGRNGKPLDVNIEEHEYEFSARSSKGKPSKHKRSGWSKPSSIQSM